jgi:hypothetical protein
MKKCKVVDRYRLYECLLGIILIGVILFGHVNNLNNINKEEYKSKQRIYILLEKQQDEFLKDWNGLPRELREWMDTYEVDKFVEMDIPLSRELQEYTYEMCKEYDVDYIFALSIMRTESSFKVNAKCKNLTDNYYSRGLMQLNERYISEFVELTEIKDFNINNPKHNIEGGVAKLSNLNKFWGKYELGEEDNWYAVTNSYNLGLNKYKKQVTSRGSFFTREYDRKVLKNKEKLEGGI